MESQRERERERESTVARSTKASPRMRPWVVRERDEMVEGWHTYARPSSTATVSEVGSAMLTKNC